MLAGVLNSIAQNLRDTLARVRGVGEAVGTVHRPALRARGAGELGASTVLHQIQDTERSMAEVMNTLQGVGTRVEPCSAVPRRAPAGSRRWPDAHDEVAQRVEEMAVSVQRDHPPPSRR